MPILAVCKLDYTVSVSKGAQFLLGQDIRPTYGSEWADHLAADTLVEEIVARNAPS
jgi:hypothetical protein